MRVASAAAAAGPAAVAAGGGPNDDGIVDPLLDALTSLKIQGAAVTVKVTAVAAKVDNGLEVEYSAEGGETVRGRIPLSHIDLALLRISASNVRGSSAAVGAGWGGFDRSQPLSKQRRRLPPALPLVPWIPADLPCGLVKPTAPTQKMEKAARRADALHQYVGRELPAVLLAVATSRDGAPFVTFSHRKALGKPGPEDFKVRVP